MKILYIANRYNHGEPELGSSNNYHNYYEGLVKMNNGENEVLFFPRDVMTKKKGAEKTHKELLSLIFREKPNLVFAHAIDLNQKEIIKKITQKSGAVTFIWFFDDHWDFYKDSKYWAPFFHWVFTTDPLAIEKYYKIGYKNAVFMPPCFNRFRYKPLNLPKIYDVTFVGSPHGVRKKIIKKLKKAGINVVCFGQGWPRGYISTEEKIKIISQSKINLNLSESSGVLWKQIVLIFLHRNFDRSIGVNSPLKWYDNFQTLLAQKRKQIKGRIFKVLGCRGFLLSGYAEKLEELYTPNKEIVFFYNFNELVEKIKYYLAHDEEREKIAKAGYERSLRDHTCEKRFNEMFKIMGKDK